MAVANFGHIRADLGAVVENIRVPTVKLPKAVPLVSLIFAKTSFFKVLEISISLFREIVCQIINKEFQFSITDA